MSLSKHLCYFIISSCYSIFYIKTGSYEKDGVKHYTQDVQVDKVELLSGKSDGNATQPAPAKVETTPTTPIESASESDIPF